ncbi:MAG: hypothetical protein MUF54_16900 [Polyangiaceae bacterium]|nr:hypothetical protein [Polyangiaceae bacterium]
MPSGDAQRRWFPDMISRLRVRWRPDLSWSEIITLRDDLDAMLHDIRDRRGIKAPVFRCPDCGAVGPSEPGPLSVRAVILAVGRFDIISPDEVKALEKSWASHRRTARLDLAGHPQSANPSDFEGCDRGCDHQK